MTPDARAPDRLDELLDAILAAPEAEQRAAMERGCAANPAEAEALRRRFHCLVQFGLCSTSGLAPLTGSVLSGYRLDELLGGGGMGSVYRAVRQHDGAECAVKVMHSELRQVAKARERLLREGRIAGELRHRNLCEVLEVGDDHGTPFLVMQLVHGESLAQGLRREPAALSGSVQAVARTAAAIEKVARALGALHARGLVHRDVKPANVLLDREDEPVLVDFGLARETVSATLTVSGTPVGTPAYMPPEQVRGEHDVTPAADVYALGATLFECLAQRPPFLAGDRQTLFASILADDPPDLTRANRFVGKDLFAIVLRCLQKRPERRYADGRALAADLQAVRQGHRPMARLPSLPQRTTRWVRRHPIAMLSVVVGVLAVGLGCWLVAQMSRLARAQAIAVASDSAALDQLNPVAAALLAREAFRTADTYATRSRLLAAIANLAQVGEVHVGGNLGWFGLSPDGERLACGVSAFGITPTTPRIVGAAPPHTFVGTGHAGAWSGDGKRFATAGANTLQLFDGATGALLAPPLTLPGKVHTYALSRPAPVLQFDGEYGLHVGLDDGRVHSFSSDLQLLGSMAIDDTPIRWLHATPDGGLAVLTNRGTIATLDAEGVETHRIDSGINGQVSAVSAATGTPWLAFGTSGGQVRRARLAPRIMVEDVGALAGEVTAVAIASDGATVAAATNTRAIWVRRGDGETTLAPHVCLSVPFAIALADDGSTIALGEYQGAVRVFDARLRQTRLLAGHREVVNGLRFVAGGRLASCSWDGTIRFWELHNQATQSLAGAEGAVFAAGWHPDGRHVLGVDYAGRLLSWDTAGGLPKATAIDAKQSGFGAIAIAADGRRVATGGNYHVLHLWDANPDGVPTLVPEDDTPTVPEYIRELRFARDGSLFIARNNWLVGLPAGGSKWVHAMSEPATDVLGLDLSPAEDEVAAAAMDGKVVVCGRTGEPVDTFQFPCAVWTVAFVPARRCLVAGLGNGDIVMLDRDSRVRTVWRGHDGHVRKIAWSPDGEHLLSGGGDGTVRLWRRDGSPVCELLHRGIVHFVAFAPDGQHLLSAGSDGLVRIWPLPVGDLAGVRIFRDFTEEERLRFADLLQPTWRWWQ